MLIIAKDQVREPLYVVVPLFNHMRWKTRWKHTERALKHFIDSGAVVYLVECTFNRREAVFADSGIDGLAANCGVLGSDHNFRHRYIHLQTTDELWLKENMINVAVGRLPHDWQQMAWLDSDIHFVRPNWVGEAIHKLQMYDWLQMFSHARDVGPNYEMLPEDHPHADGIGFMQAFHQGRLDAPVQASPSSSGGYPYPGRVWPGLAWACTRWGFEAVGGLLDFAIWGGADFTQAWCLVEKPELGLHNGLHRNYKKMVYQWYYRCKTHIRRNVGVMDGSVLHHFHGKKSQRHYGDKHRLLADLGFDPLRHLKRDSQGLWILHDDRSAAFVQLRDTMRRIAKERNEDSPETGLESPSTQGH